MAVKNPRSASSGRLRVESLESRRVMSAGDPFSANLFGAIDGSAASTTNFGLVGVFSSGSGGFVPVAAESRADAAGVSGLAFESPDVVFAVTATPAGARLRRIDATSGAEQSETPVRLGDGGVTVDDLAEAPGELSLLAVGRSASDPADQNWLLSIDPLTGRAERRGLLDLRGNVSLATVAVGGVVYAVGGGAAGELELQRIDPASGTALQRVTLRTAPLANPVRSLRGLAADAAGVLVGADATTQALYRIDAVTGAVTEVAIAGPSRGAVGDLAFRPGTSVPRREVFATDFEAGLDGFSIDNAGSPPGMWHRSVGRRGDGHASHSTIHSLYYGQFETSIGGGRYDLALPARHRGVAESPRFGVPADGTTVLSFNYVLDVRPELDRDFVSVSVDDGSSVTTLLSRQDGSLPSTIRGRWRTATVDLTAYAGREVSIQFAFDTGDPPTFDPEGWYVDDFAVVNFASPSVDPLTGSISGVKFDDQDGDGLRDPGEPGLAGAEFRLVGPGGFVATVVSGADGSYSFGPLAAGVYTLTETAPPAGFAGGFVETITVGAGQMIDRDVPNLRLGSISGVKFDDQDGDGLRDPGEPVLAGAQFRLVGPGGFEVTDVSGADGSYAFRSLAAGVYTLTETTPPTGFQGGFDAMVSVAIGEDVVRNIPNVPSPTPPGSISGVKFDDQDGDGQRDPGEPVLAGAQFRLVGPGGFDDTRVSESDGSYSFDSLPAGVYTLTETAPPAGFSGGFVEAIIVGVGEDVVRNIPNSAVPPTPAETVTFVTPLGVYRGGVAPVPYVRPVDDHFGYADPRSRVSGAKTFSDPREFPAPSEFGNADELAAALAARQRFVIPGSEVGSSFSLDWEIDLSSLESDAARREALARHFVTVYYRQASGQSAVPYMRVEEHQTIGVTAGQPLELFFFYDPVERDDTGNVLAQFPDWTGDPPRDGVHTFVPGDHLLFESGSAAKRFNLVGGSTFDSDVNYDGRVDDADVRMLDAFIRENLGPVSQGDLNFDPTLDVNVRDLTGSGGVLGPGPWPILVPTPGPDEPRRTIDGGDTLAWNRERNSTRTALPPVASVSGSGGLPESNALGESIGSLSPAPAVGQSTPAGQAAALAEPTPFGADLAYDTALAPETVGTVPFRSVPNVDNRASAHPSGRAVTVPANARDASSPGGPAEGQLLASNSQSDPDEEPVDAEGTTAVKASDWAFGMLAPVGPAGSWREF